MCCLQKINDESIYEKSLVARLDEALVIFFVKRQQEKVTEKILIFNSQEANEDINDMYDVLKKLENIILEFDQKFEKRK